LQYSLTWAAQAEGTATNSTFGDFYPVYVVDQGVLILKGAAPELDSVKVALARYDRESNGSYIVRGFEVKYQGVTDGQQIFVLNEGKAHVDGYEIELPHSVRLKYELNPDLSTVQSEPHTFQPDDFGNMQITLNNPTCSSIQAVDITQQKTAKMLKNYGLNSTPKYQVPRPAAAPTVMPAAALNARMTLFINLTIICERCPYTFST
jgi:hypothetical protein